MKKKIVFTGLLIFAIAVVVVGLRFRGLQEETDGIWILYNGTKQVITYSELGQETFQGALVNGKGEHSMHEYRGVELAELLKSYQVDLNKVSEVQVVSADQYAATVMVEEVTEEGRVIPVVEADGNKIEGIDAGEEGAQLIVFEDPDSKRCVRSVQKIEVIVN